MDSISSLEKLVQDSYKVVNYTSEKSDQKLYLCPSDFQSKVFRKYIWVVNDINRYALCNWIELSLPDCGDYKVGLKATGSTVAIFGERTKTYTNTYENHLNEGKVSSKIHVVGNGWMKTSEWLNVPNVNGRVFYMFGTPPGENLDSILCPTMLIPSFKHKKEKTLQSVLVLTIEFAYKNDIEDEVDYAVTVPREHGLFSTQKLYNEKIFADFKFVVKPNNAGDSEGEEIMAHKLILAARSKVFKTMLTVDMVEKKFCRIEIVDFEPKVVHEFLKYLYIGEANLEENAVELLKFSDKYDVPELLELCQKYIGKNIVKIGWEVVFQLMNTYGGIVPILMDMVQDYYKKNETVLKNSTDFQESIAMFPQLFVKLYIPKN